MGERLKREKRNIVLRGEVGGLMDVERMAENEEETKERWERRREQDWRWSEVAEALVKTAEEVCDQVAKGVVRPWTKRR